MVDFKPSHMPYLRFSHTSVQVSHMGKKLDHKCTKHVTRAAHTNFGGGNRQRREPTAAPNAAPHNASAGPQNSVTAKFSPVDKATAKATPNPVIAKTSSKLDAATTRVGIPSATPQPATSRRIMFGTITAGETAAHANLK